jgi:sugar-specific transcriptional regulator TrmB
MLESTLKTLGLNENEIKVYLTLITLGSTPASAVAKRADIERSHTVYICKNLVKKGFISYVEKNNTFIFTPVPPKELLNIVYKEKREVESKEFKLQRIIGQLENMINPNASLPKIQFFEGVDGVINIYKDMLKDNKNIYDCNVVDRTSIHEDIIEYWEQEYMPQREKMTNKSFTLYNRESGKHEYTKYDKKVRRTTLFLPEKTFPFKSQILIYGEKIAFCSLSPTNLTGAIIENKAIWETQFSLFRLAWNYARLLPENEQHKNIII